MSARRSSFVRLLALLGALCLGGAAQADFNPVHADLDRDGSVTVVDALQILAQALD